MSLETYVPVLMFIAVALGFGCLLLAVGWVLSPSKPDPEQLAPYECGFEAFEDARMRFDVRYYLVAILFILFDLEMAFLAPWAVALSEMAAWGSGFWAFIDFMVVLTIGYIYAWKKGALDWE